MLVNQAKKFFKRLSLIDYVFVGLLVVATVLALSFFMRKKAVVYVEMTFKHQDWREWPLPPEYWQVEAIKVGDGAYNSLGRKVAEVVEVEKSYWDYGRNYVELVLRVEGTFNNNIKAFVFDGKPLLVGKELSLNIGKTEFKGMIKNVYQKPEDRFKGLKKAKAEIAVKFREYEAWHAEALRDFEVKNSQGKVILRTKKAEITPAEVLTYTYLGEARRSLHPFKKDVVLIMELPEVLCNQQMCYFNGYQPLKVGYNFWAGSEATFVGSEGNEELKGSIMDLKIEAGE